MLTAAQLATHLSVSVRHVERCAAAGMPSISVGVRAKRYDAAACLSWLAENSGALSQCPSNAPRKAATKFVSASAVNALTAASRRALLRLTQRESNQS